MHFNASYSKNKKAQLKIQQMAFVLIAIIIFFALVALVYFSVKVNSIKKEAGNLEGDKAKKLVQRLSGVAELKWSKDCSNCIDLDKAMVLKNRSVYSQFFGVDYLALEVLYPEKSKKECTIGNYPDCNIITLVKDKEFDTASRAYVALCRWDQNSDSEKCELGAIYASGNSINE